MRQSILPNKDFVNDNFVKSVHSVIREQELILLLPAEVSESTGEK